MTRDPSSEQPGNRVIYPTSKLAVAALVLGILALWPLGILSAIPAVICGHMALRQIKGSNGTVSGSGYARFGLVVGYLELVILIVAAIVAPILAHSVQVDLQQLESSQASH